MFKILAKMQSNWCKYELLHLRFTFMIYKGCKLFWGKIWMILVADSLFSEINHETAAKHIMFNINWVNVFLDEWKISHHHDFPLCIVFIKPLLNFSNQSSNNGFGNFWKRNSIEIITQGTKNNQSTLERKKKKKENRSAL